MDFNNDTTPINIVMISYYSKEIVERVIDRINERTETPFRLIVGDNLSENSPEIREMLRQKVDEGKISRAYFYDDNYMTTILNHMVELEMNDAKFTIITDHDALLSEDVDPKWLDEFKECFNNMDNVAGIGFRSMNGNLSENGVNKNNDTKKEFCINMEDGRCMFNAHYFAFDNTLLKRYMNNKRPIVDGGLRQFVDEIRRIDGINYKLIRYDKTPVSNLSSDLCGVSKTTDLETDKKYLNMRRKVLHGKINEEGKGFLNYYPIGGYQAYEK